MRVPIASTTSAARPQLVRDAQDGACERIARASITPSPMRNAVTGACSRSASSRTSFEAPCAPPPTMISGRSAFAEQRRRPLDQRPSRPAECAARPRATPRSAPRSPTCRSAPRCRPAAAGPRRVRSGSPALPVGASDALSTRFERFRHRAQDAALVDHLVQRAEAAADLRHRRFARAGSSPARRSNRRWRTRSRHSGSRRRARGSRPAACRWRAPRPSPCRPRPARGGCGSASARFADATAHRRTDRSARRADNRACRCRPPTRLSMTISAVLRLGWIFERCEACAVTSFIACSLTGACCFIDPTASRECAPQPKIGPSQRTDNHAVSSECRTRFCANRSRPSGEADGGSHDAAYTSVQCRTPHLRERGAYAVPAQLRYHGHRSVFRRVRDHRRVGFDTGGRLRLLARWSS